MTRLALLALMTCALYGCGPTIVPLDSPGATIDVKTSSIRHLNQGVDVSLRVQDLDYPPYRQVDTITSLHLTVVNQTQASLVFPVAGLLLVDSHGQQYHPITPGQVEELVKRDFPYLVPYPYVGYYYLEDAQRGSWFNTFTSDLPFYASRYPQDIYTEALPTEPILPGNRAAGLVYFVVDLTTKERFEVRLYLDGKPAARTPDMVFPFAVEK